MLRLPRFLRIGLQFVDLHERDWTYSAVLIWNSSSNILLAITTLWITKQNAELYSACWKLVGNSLDVQWLGLGSTLGPRFNPWSGNKKPTSHLARPGERKEKRKEVGETVLPVQRKNISRISFFWSRWDGVSGGRSHLAGLAPRAQPQGECPGRGQSGGRWQPAPGRWPLLLVLWSGVWTQWQAEQSP